MSNHFNPSNLNISDHAQHHRAVIQTYCQIATQPTLSDHDTARLDTILATAETDPLLSFLIDEADHMLAHLHGLIDDVEIADQQQKLQTCLSEAWLNQAFQDLTHRLQESQCQHLQQYLQQEGFYQGAIDGVMGPATKAAIKQCCEQRGELPQPLPIHTPDPVSG
ncbi:peptidoglycan-binding protein [Leptolyngbya cf. ectocarpi LEGE 11479]|uniref:Peptidoglycan-binding protein n=1 Tax=Leptolyngbya cf. ectocarpi LEGE 11479 TaxID=1828722 RepID=A0A928ZTR5_LEPEC|nr:peptidoglycan-binding domain-containing protein [Leptolyngbya ectocarpi]MBE9066854.1 peptidoglycan-binding protein [Leptolyngbya cf. ectocarpi LEGE 11479]